jgi:hypothetical protein
VCLCVSDVLWSDEGWSVSSGREQRVPGTGGGTNGVGQKEREKATERVQRSLGERPELHVLQLP